MIRVLVAEDSPTARALLVAILGGDPEIQVIGEAENGAQAVALTQKLRPDVVTMDMRMPGLDGFEATKEIMITAPTPIIIVTSSYEGGEVEKSMHALRAGALAIIAKPAGPGAVGFEEAAQQLRTQVKAMSQVKVVRHWRPAKPAAARHLAAGAPPGRVRLVAVAASTGGPAALHAILSQLPRDFPAPLLVVQHISTGFTAGLADWLDKACNLRCKVAEQGDPLQAGAAYLAPDGLHLGVSPRGTIALSAGPPVGGFRPSATFLFQAVAQVYGSTVLAIILTGMGEDGVAGLHDVRQSGGRIIAQDEKSSVVFGMPGAAIAAGLADAVLPLNDIAARMVELANW